ncbi:tyrosine-protein phosphatase [Arthrobacter nitrophenolicus]|jgi:protein-tyrosine phosphatase|uniref:Tyrosine-protein phosphatase n=1 Tax=Arthrobacter nitrophenolicus TaxID=683150 RepID=A0A4R5Y550_9MICC|nr:tyrosine-protein phosphatase [Arthrobacter nitrophenolicus]TDL38757.1 tyrosine-protein phosphatase [Arthrobacter nitrophenolicus]
MTATITDIELSAPVNLRDLGGIPVEGGLLRNGLALRADDLSVITDEDARTLVEGGLAAVIDLRTKDEAALTGRGPLAGYPVAYHHLPLMESISAGMPDGDAPVIEHVAMGMMYARMVEAAAPQLASALGIIALAPGATAFHCAAGRDRTGVLAAMLLLALGATDDDIVADYARTHSNMAAVMQRMKPTMGALMARLGFDLDAMAVTFPDEPMDISMHTMLARLRERHGDALAPLRAAGLGADTIARLRHRALA